MGAKRNYSFDTMRCFLIFTVIMGHGIKFIMGKDLRWIYLTIFTFHMPAFIFITGKFAKFDPGKIMKRLVLPYVLFQTIGLCFEAIVMDGKPIELYYARQYYGLWFLVAIIVYHILIPMLPAKGSKRSYWLIGISVVLALLVGYDRSCGKVLSIARIVTFAPFFLWGYYDEAIRERLFRKAPGVKTKIIACVLLLGLIVAGERYICNAPFEKELLYGSETYADCNAMVWDRMIAMATASCVIVLMCIATPKRRIPLVSTAGSNTLPIYLMHLFVIKLIEKYKWYKCFTRDQNLILLIGLSVVLIAVFGNPYTAKAFRAIFCAERIGKPRQ